MGIQSGNPQLLHRQFPGMDGASVLDAIHGAACGRVGCGVQRALEGIDEVVSGHRRIVIVVPNGVLAQLEGELGKIGVGSPTLRHTGHSIAVGVQAG